MQQPSIFLSLIIIMKSISMMKWKKGDKFFKCFILSYFIKFIILAQHNRNLRECMQEEELERRLMAMDVQRVQNQALKRARNLKRRPKTSLKKSQQNHIRNKSDEKMPKMAPDNKYSIQKLNQKNQLQYVSQSKQLTRKMCAKLKLQKFSFQHVIGCGIFGRVWRAEERTSHKLYAIKEISKSLILMKKGLATVLNERNIITQLHHPLIPSLINSFQTELNLYLILPLMEKGDLRYHITKFKQFSQKEVRFFIACIVSVLEYLRKQGIIHRDIKPENLLLDQSGYLYVSDFGIAQRVDDAVQGVCCGTPAYMAPEVLFEREYGFTVDYYAVGVLLHEMMTGQRPYATSNRQELKAQMSKHSAFIKKDQIPEGWSIESADFANKLLYRHSTTRLGHTSISQLKTHPWLINFPWQKLERRELVSPYCEPFNHWEVDYGQLFTVKNKEEMRETEGMLARGELQELFDCFTYEGFEKSMEYTTKPSYQLKI